MKRNQIILIIVAGLFILSLIYFGGQSLENYVPAASKFEPQINSEGGVSVEATPINFENGKQIQFKIVLTTHQGDLDFDLTQNSVLVDNLGNIYSPLEWQGGRGGHHLSGILVFPLLSVGVKEIKLRILDVYGVKEREFIWNLE